jgi:linoleate 10R-lipoxygenase
LEWNSDPKVANTAEKLYGDIENLELYVGLQAEETKPVMEGAGLCPGRFGSNPLLNMHLKLSVRIHYQPCHLE